MLGYTAPTRPQMSPNCRLDPSRSGEFSLWAKPPFLGMAQRQLLRDRRGWEGRGQKCSWPPPHCEALGSVLCTGHPYVTGHP